MFPNLVRTVERRRTHNGERLRGGGGEWPRDEWPGAAAAAVERDGDRRREQDNDDDGAAENDYHRDHSAAERRHAARHCPAWSKNANFVANVCVNFVVCKWDEIVADVLVDEWFC